MKPSECIEAVETAVTAGEVPFLWGTWGSGKSESVEDLAKRLGRKLYQIRLSLIDPVDLRGCPVVVTDEEGNHLTKWGYPSFFPTEPGSMVFFDEMNTGLPQVQAACYQLILDKACGEHKLPPDTAMVCAGNREADGGITHKMPRPLQNRLVHLDWELDVDDWVAWALANGIRTDIIAFIRFRRILLHQDWIDQDANREAISQGKKPEKKSEDGAKKGKPSPRTWVKLSHLMDACETKGASSSVEFGLAVGCVGEGPGTEYLSYRRIASSLVTPEQIIMAPETAPIPDQQDKSGPAATYAIVTALATKATDKTIERVMRYADRLPADFQVVLVDDILKKQPGLINTTCMIAWASRNSDVVR